MCVGGKVNATMSSESRSSTRPCRRRRRTSNLACCSTRRISREAHAYAREAGESRCADCWFRSGLSPISPRRQLELSTKLTLLLLPCGSHGASRDLEGRFSSVEDEEEWRPAALWRDSSTLAAACSFAVMYLRGFSFDPGVTAH